MAQSQDLEIANEWDSLLKELAAYHQHAEQELCQQHWEERKLAGLGPDVLMNTFLFSSEEIMRELSSLAADLQKADPPVSGDDMQENSVSRCSEAF